jgi:hypothetical protein
MDVATFKTYTLFAAYLGIGKICAQTVKNFYHKNNSHSKTRLIYGYAIMSSGKELLFSLSEAGNSMGRAQAMPEFLFILLLLPLNVFVFFELVILLISI